MSTPAELLRALGREARAGGGRNGARADDPAVRVYRGRSVDDIIPQIQRELGADAIIVRRRDGLAGGVLGFFQHPYVEIEAMRGVEGVDIYDEDEPVGPPEPTPAAAPEPEPPPPPLRQPPPRVSPDPVQQPAPAATRPTPAPSSAYVSTQLAALARAAPAEGGFRAPPATAHHDTPYPDAPYPDTPYPAPPRSAPPRPAPPRSAPPYPEAPYPASPGPEAPYVDTPHHEAPYPAPPRPAVPPLDTPRPTAPPAAVEQRPAPTPVQRASEPLGRAHVDFHELIVRDEPQPYADADAAFAEYAPPRRRAPVRERRAVAPGSQARARAGVERGLRRVGVSAELARELVEGAAAHTLPLAPRSGLAQAVRTTLAQRIPVAPPLPTRGAAIVVVGAGGTGKTTCCAALLAAYRNGSTLPASFATLTRGAERGDLRLILAPRIVKPIAAGTPRALSALRRSKDDGLTVVDTPRLSPADKAGIRALALLLGELKPERIVVALPATLGAEAAAQLLSALRPLGANALAVTHVDETDQIGVAIEAACRFSLAPEYLLDCSPSGAWRLRRVDPSELAGRLLP
jgi:flagellar biosynthesis GTPase FlhF